MAKRLKSQLENSKEIKNVLRKANLNYRFNGKLIDIFLIYLPCKDNVCDHSDFLRVIKDTIMTKFVLSFSEIQNKLSIRNNKGPEELFKKSVRKLSKHTAKGELGELILFTLLDVYFEAPKILSKISYKTNRRMAVHGADAVHAQFIDGKLRLYLGESKMHKKFSNAATYAVDSISSTIEKYTDEFDLIDSHIDFPDMNSEAKLELLEFLNPFSEQQRFNPEMLYSPCFIGFVEPSVFCDDEKCYLAEYKKLAKKYIISFYSKLEKQCDVTKTTLLLLPFSSLDVLVDEFISCMGIDT
ncbi:MAG: DUF1837 domain-containing protein [Pseudomonadota bacterium]